MAEEGELENYLNTHILIINMSETILKHLDKDLEILKRDISLIKHILSQEGKLSVFARKALQEARATPDSEYVSHEELKRRILK